MKKYLLMTLMIVLVTIFFFYGFTEATAAPSPQYGGILKLTRGRLTGNIGNPAKMGSADLENRSFYVEALLTYSAKSELKPLLAESWEYSQDYKTLTLHLRKGVKFHDGTDFNAAAAKFNLDIFKRTGRGEMENVSSIDLVDDYTVKLNLSHYSLNLLNNLTQYAGLMLSPTSIQAHDEEWQLTHAVGTGPFILTEYQNNVGHKGKKNPNYWQVGKPYLDGVEMVSMEEETTRSASIQKGDLHLILSNDPKISSDLKNKGFIVSDPLIMHLLVGDSGHSDSPFSDVRVRKAVSYAIDMKGVSSIGQGVWQPINQPAVPGTIYYNPNVAGYPYNPEKAKTLLAEAGYSKGFSTTIFYAASPINELQAVAFQSYLKKVGIDAKLEGMSRGAFGDIRKKGWNNGLILHGMNLAREKGPGQILQGHFYKGAMRYQCVDYPNDYMAQFTKIFNETDDKARLKLDHELLEMFVDKYCILTCAFLDGFVVITNPKVHNVYFGLWTYGLDVTDAWIEK